MKSILIIILFLFTSCDFVEVKSTNEPKTDQDAFKLVGITYQLKSSIVHKEFQAGMDDHMKLVFDLPKEDLEDFWEESPFTNEKKTIYGSTKESELPMTRLRLSKLGESIWTDWQKVTSGTYSEARLPKARFAKVFISPKDNKNYRCYLVWHET